MNPLKAKEKVGKTKDLQTSFTVIEETFPPVLPIEERYPADRVVRDEVPSRVENLVVRDDKSSAVQVVESTVRELCGWNEPGEKPKIILKEIEEIREMIKEQFDGRSGRLCVIYGFSGSGKTLLLKEIIAGVKENKEVAEGITWEDGKAVISHFEDGVSGKPGYFWLLSTGLNSIRSWCKPYRILSTGEKYRAFLARRLANFCKSRERSIAVEDSVGSSSGFVGDGTRRLNHPFIVDDLCLYLDNVTAMNCAISLSKFLKSTCTQNPKRTKVDASKSMPNSVSRDQFQFDLNAVICCNSTRLIRAMQPDVVIHTTLVPEGPNQVISTRIIKLSAEHSTPLPAGFTIQLDVPNSLPLLLVEGNPPDIGAEDIGKSAEFLREDVSGIALERTVVVTTVLCDEKTDMCNALFDHRFTGETSLILANQFLHERAAESESDNEPGWRLGVIVGSSGSLKSMYMKYYFGNPPVVIWNPETSIVLDHFQVNTPEEARLLREVLALFNKDSVCYASVLLSRDYRTLSVSEKELMHLARLLYSALTDDSIQHRVLCIDEFLSTLDSTASVTVCRNVFKFIKQSDRLKKKLLRFVVVSCRADVLASDLCDWIHETSTNTLRKKISQFLNQGITASPGVAETSFSPGSFERPELKLTLKHCSPDLWYDHLESLLSH